MIDGSAASRSVARLSSRACGQWPRGKATAFLRAGFRVWGSMLESLLADVLTRVLGQYVSGIDRDSISFGVWGGCLELRDLTLRAESVALIGEKFGLEIPVTAVAGCIGLLRITVPWKSLASTPVTIHVEHLTVVARPVTGDHTGASELANRERRLCRSKLDTDDAVREAAWTMRSGAPTASDTAPVGWTSRLVTRIVDNIQIEIDDVIVRYEDAVSDKRRPYCVALLCERLRAVSAGESWEQAFIDNPHAPETRKIIDVAGFRVNWGPLASDSTSGESNSELGHFDSHQELRTFVLDGHGGDSHEDSLPIIAPFNGLLRASLLKAASSRAGVPGAAVELDVDFPDVEISLNDVQYASLLQTSIYFAKLSTRGFRPENAKERWVWAVEQMLPGFRSRSRAAKCLTLQEMQKRSIHRQLYLSSRAAVLKARRTGVDCPPDMAKQVEELEHDLSYDDIILYRDLTDDQIADVSKTWKLKEDTPPDGSPTNAGTTTGAFWSYLGYADAEAAKGQSAAAGGESGAANDDEDEFLDARSEYDEKGADVLAIAASGSRTSVGSVMDERDALRAGVVIGKFAIQLHRGGYPSASEPMVEVVIRDLRVGVTLSPGDGTLVEAVLGTCEAWNLQSNDAMVYPRVPWNPERSSRDKRKGAVTSGADTVHEEAHRVDNSCSESGRSQDEAKGSAEFVDPEKVPLRISNSSYPANVSEALDSIKLSFVGDSGEMSASKLSGLNRRRGRSLGRGSDTLESEEDDWIADTTGDDDGFVNNDTALSLTSSKSRTSASGSTFISESEFLGSASLSENRGAREEPSAQNTDSQLHSLDYLVALRIYKQGRRKTWDTGIDLTNGTLVDIAVGRLEAVVDGPAGNFLWGLKFWQPKGTAQDPILSFVGAAAGARIAALRMELQNTLLAREAPMRIDAVICAPRFILPGRNELSCALVVNMGTFRFDSPGSHLKSLRRHAQDPSAPSRSERYSSYTLSLDDLGVYLAPNFESAVSRRISRASNQAADGGNPFGLEQTCSTSKTYGVERIVRPFSLRVVLQTLQNVQVVQVAHQGPGKSDESTQIAKLRVRGRIPGIRLVLSQRACHHLIRAGKRWSGGLPNESARSGGLSVSQSEVNDRRANASDGFQGVRSSDTPLSTASDGSEGIYAALASLDAKFAVDTMSLELRDRQGSRIITILASGTRAKIIKTGFDELTADFRLQSWTVTDGSRGTTAAFRRLAYAGGGAEERAVSPPHTLTAASVVPGSSGEDCDTSESFVHIELRQQFSTGDSFASIRFLSLHMVCVRETYAKISSFCYGLLKDLRTSRLEEKSLFSPSIEAEDTPDPAIRSPEGTEPPSDSGLSPPFPAALGDNAPKSVRGRRVLKALLDGFTFQLVSMEGALASVEMSKFAINAETSSDGGSFASGDVGYVALRDLTSPLEQHANALVYQRAPMMLERMQKDDPEEVGDGWSISLPSSSRKLDRPSQAFVRAKFQGMRIIFLTRFVNVLSRYFAVLQRGLQPAVDEVRAVAAETAISSNSASVPPDEDVSGNGLRFVLEMIAEDVEFRLPRHSTCCDEAISLSLRTIRLSNERQPAPGYHLSLRVEVRGIMGKLLYMAPRANGAGVAQSGEFLNGGSAEYRVDMWRRVSGSEGRADDVSTENSPPVRARFLINTDLVMTLCEAQYTVLYFVITENFAETVEGGNTDFARSMPCEDDDSTEASTVLTGSQDGDDLPRGETVDTQPSPVGASQPSRDPVVMHLDFEIAAVQFVVARGWDISDSSCHVLSALVRGVKGAINITSKSHVGVEMTTKLAEVLDVREEATEGANMLILPLTEEFSREGKGDSGGLVDNASENMSLRYEKPYGDRANIVIVLSNIQLSVIPELFRDLSCLAIPGWPFLDTSPVPPLVPYLGRTLTVTLSKSQVWFGAEQYAGDPRALLLGGDVIARINWIRGTAAKKVSVQTKGLNLVLTFQKKHAVKADVADGRQRVALPVTSQDAMIMYPGDGSLEYIGPNVDESGRRLQILAEFVLCRVSVKEVPLLAAVIKRQRSVKESSLSSRDWKQENPLAEASLAAVGGLERSLSSSQAVATRKTLTLLMSTPAARLLVTDESRGKFVPILEWNMRNAMVQANMPRVLQFASEWSMNLFNEAKGWWEPGLELWAVELSMSTGESGSRAYSVTSTTKMNLNVTPSILSGASRVTNALRSANSAISVGDDLTAADPGMRKEGDQRPSVAAFHICNRLGMPITMWLPHDPVRKAILNGDEAKVDMARDSFVPGAEANDIDDNLSRDLALRCSLSVAGFEPLNLSAAETGVHVVHLHRDLSADSKKLHDSLEKNDDLQIESSSPVVWEVVMRGGVPICTLRSLVRLLNETTTSMEISIRAVSDDSLFDSDVDKERSLLYVVDPGLSFSVPMQSLDSEIRVRPVLVDAPNRRNDSLDDLDAILGETRSQSDEEENAFFETQTPPRRTPSSVAEPREKDDLMHAGYSYDWSPPLPDSSWLSTAAAAGIDHPPTKKSVAANLLNSFNPGTSASSSQSLGGMKHGTETLCCTSLLPHAADFHVVAVPRIASIASLRSEKHGETSGWLDIGLLAPVTLENLLPGLLSYRFSAANARVIGSGVLKPNERLHLHSCRPDDNETLLALAFDNAAEALIDPDVNDENVFGISSDVEPPLLFGQPQSLEGLVREKRGLFVEPFASSSSKGSSTKKDAKELCVRVTSASTMSHVLSVWSQFWIRNRSDVNLEFCGRSSYYSGGTAVRPLRPCPPGSLANKFVCFEGPYVSLRDASARGEWWTYQSDLGDAVKPIPVGIPGVSLVMEVRPATGSLPNTMVVIIRNASWIVNRTPTSLQWCQSTALDHHGNVRLRHVCTLPAGNAHSIHWDSKADVKAINVRLTDEEDDALSGWFWSPAVPLDLGNKGEFPAKMYRPKSQEQYIARVVGIKLHGGSQALFVYPQDTANPPYRVVNACRYRSIAFHQVGSEDRPWLVRPGKSTRYSWDDPLASTRRRELRVEVIEIAPPNWSRSGQDPSGSVAGEHQSRIVGSGGPSEWPGVSSAVAASWAEGRQYHHPKFNLNIDIVQEQPVEKHSSFEPGLLACITVDGATKVVTFRDCIQKDKGEELPDSGTGIEPRELPTYGADVPTVGWDDDFEASSPSEREGKSEVSSADPLEGKTDYPPRDEVLASEGAGADEVSHDVDVNIFLSGVGVSIVDSTPVELAYAHAKNVFLKHERYEASVQTNFDITELQIDNQLPNAAFPVLLWAPMPDLLLEENHCELAGHVRTVALEAKQSLNNVGITMWKSIRGAARPLDVAVDEEFVLRCIDFCSDVAKGSDEPEQENITGHDGEHRGLGDHYEALADEIVSGNDLPSSQLHESPGLARIYVEELKLFPVKMFLSSYASRGTMRSAGYRSSSMRALVAILLNVENCEFDFAALELRHVFDSSQHFSLLVREYYVAQLNNQRMKLLTSNSLIGNPAALFDSVSLGARDLFVEPGRAKGSVEFLASVGRGSRSLVTNTVGGLAGSIGGIPKAVSSGLETAVGDRRYLAERERIRSHRFSGGLRPLSGTPAQGVANGAMSFAHGISSGVSGLITDPVRGAKQGGAAGFLKGMGKGLVGGIVKPVAGVMDLIAEPAAGLSSSVGAGDSRRRGKRNVAPVRPPRAFVGSGMRLVPYDMRSATGEALLKATALGASLRIDDKLVEWVELSDRPEREEPDAVDFLWSTIERYCRTVRGARRPRAEEASQSLPGGQSSASTLGSQESRLEKTRVGLVLENRLLVVTLDCHVVSDTPLEGSGNFEVLDDGKELVLQTARRLSDGPQSRKEVVHVWGRISCDSNDARADLHAAVDRALLALRRKSALGSSATAYSGRNDAASSIELRNIDHGSTSDQSIGTELFSLGHSTAGNGTPGVFGTFSQLPGRDSRGRPYSRENSKSRETSVPTGTERSAAAAARRELELTSAVRRLSMGGTRREVDAKRSIRIIVANSLPSGSSVRLIRSSLEDGFWREPPPKSIASGTATLFEADSGGAADKLDRWQMNRDVRGSVLFGVNTDDMNSRSKSPTRAPQITLEFSNPVMSSPTYGVQSSPGVYASYDRGSGNHATVVFTISDRPVASAKVSPSPPSRSLRASHDALSSSVALPLPVASKSSPSVGSSAASAASGAGRLFKAGSKRFISAASSFGAGSIASVYNQGQGSRAGSSSDHSRPPPFAMSSSQHSMVGSMRNLDEAAVAQLVELGFTREAASKALIDAKGDIVQAVDALTR